MIETRQPRIEAALEIVDAEVTAIDAEEDAFAAFGNRLESVDPDATRTKVSDAVTGGGSGAGTAGVRMITSRNTTVDGGLRRVRTAYRETVMAVPHFETDYDDTLEENLAKEFGDDVASAVVGGDALTPMLYRALVDAVGTARYERTRFRSLLHAERESLASIGGELNDIERRALEFGNRISESDPRVSHAEAEAELRELSERCEYLSAARQRTLHNRVVPALSGVDAESLTHYLYSSTDVRFPALSDITRCLETVAAQRRRVRR